MPEKPDTGTTGKSSGTKYRALVDLYYLDRHAKAGDIVSDLPTSSVKWLREDGAIEPVTGKED